MANLISFRTFRHLKLRLSSLLIILVSIVASGLLGAPVALAANNSATATPIIDCWL